MYPKLFSSLVLVLFLAMAAANAEVVTITTTGSVRLSEIDDFTEEDTVSGSFTYDTSLEGETYTSDDGSLKETTYAGITASFRNGSGTLAVDTSDAKITITRINSDSSRYTPRHEFRLFFPDADIPSAGTNNYPAFIGFLSFNDRTLSVLKDGKLPAAIDINDYQGTRFLFAWNRRPGDEAPLEYGGSLLSTSDTPPVTLHIRAEGELHFTPRAGINYQIEQSDDLQNWLPFGDPIEGEGSPVSLFISTTDASLRTFRVRTLAGGG